MIADVAIVGGGLAGGLAALALARLRPELRLVLVEGGERLGGNHVWSFFARDIDPDHRWLVAPLVCHAWAGHSVRFDGYERDLPDAYHSIESDRLDAVLRRVLPPGAIVGGAAATVLTPTSVRLADGRTIEAKAVIDARGAGDTGALDLGYQKFLGRRLDLDAPHGLTRPVIMDAAVDQAEGYRFVYLLPFSATSVFVEDTYYSDTPDLDTERLDARIDSYAAGRGWAVRPSNHRETGVLPVCKGGDFESYWRAGGEHVGKIGLRGGFFHAMTGYSLADAVRVAMTIAAADDLSGPALHRMLHEAGRRHWRGGAFYRLLARMLFDAAEPAERHRVLARFYRLDKDLIGRFYAGRSTRTDKLRILAGKPPVPIGRAISVLGARQS